MDDRDLQLLRAFRADEAEPHEGAFDRVHDDMWDAILAEERARAPRSARSRAGRGWRASLLRPAVAVGLAASLAAFVAVTSDGGSGGGSVASSSVTQAGVGVLDSTARALFGAESVSAPTPLAGSIDVRDTDDGERSLTDGPGHESDGQLDTETAGLAQALPRDPSQLRALLREAAAGALGSDPNDRLAFRSAMQWVTDVQVPTDLRAAMLRSLDGMGGLDAAVSGIDMLGRAGIVVGHIDASTNVRAQYLLDSSTGRLLEQRTFTTGYVDPACPAGTFTEHALYDDAGEAVDEGDAPWLAWPPVIPACDPSA